MRTLRTPATVATLRKHRIVGTVIAGGIASLLVPMMQASSASVAQPAPPCPVRPIIETYNGGIELVITDPTKRCGWIVIPVPTQLTWRS